jgi:hypothetical protein
MVALQPNHSLVMINISNNIQKFWGITIKGRLQLGNFCSPLQQMTVSMVLNRLFGYSHRRYRWWSETSNDTKIYWSLPAWRRSLISEQLARGLRARIVVL